MQEEAVQSLWIQSSFCGGFRARSTVVGTELTSAEFSASLCCIRS